MPLAGARAAKARAGILRPSAFLPAPDVPPLMGTLDADDEGVAREVAPTAADATASAPPSGCFILLRSHWHFGRLIARWAQRLDVAHAAAHRCGSPLMKALRPRPGPGLDSSGVAGPPAIGASPSGPPAPTPASSFAFWGYGHYLTTPDGGLQVSLVLYDVNVHVLACSRGSA